MSSSTYHPLEPLVNFPVTYPQVPTALSFDPVSDVLWVGSASGSVCAHYGETTSNGVTFPASSAHGEPVLKLLASENDVKALVRDAIGSWGKGGVNKWYHNATRDSLTTFTLHPTTPNTLVLAQPSPELLLLNSATGHLTRSGITAPSLISHLKSSSSLLISGSSDGFLRTHDLRANTRREEGAIEGSALAHVGGLQGLEVSGNSVYTIGWGLRNSRPYPDPLVKIFDLRTLRPLPPLPFSAGPAFINTHPKRANVVIISSNQGLVHIVDVARLNDGGEFHQLNVSSLLMATATSPTGAYIAFGDTDGLIHMLSSTSHEIHVPFNGFDGQPALWADIPDPLPDIAWDLNTPLNTIGMPYYTTPLLSSSLASSSFPSSAPRPAKIPPQILQTMKLHDGVGYATLPKELRGKRNMVVKDVAKRDGGRFRSEVGKRREDPQKSPTGFDFPNPEIPKPYRRVGIKYSKFGVEDFDFGFYNTTTHSGLETDIPNSYTNALIQVLHHVLPIRQLAKSHITTSCRTEHCLLCELGFLVRMLEDAKGINLQCSNFCKTIGRMSQATALGLVDYSSDQSETDYASMIQQFNRFLLEEMSTQGNAFPQNPHIVPSSSSPANESGSSLASPAAAPITQLLGIDAKSLIVCGHCGATREKEGMSHVVDLTYPRKALSNEPQPPADLTFASSLRSSLVRDTTYKATCQTCKQLSTFRSRRILSNEQLPPLLAVNAAVHNDDNLKYWMDGKNGTFLKSRVDVRIDGDGEEDSEGEVVSYDLRAFIVAVRVGKASHLVALVKIPQSEAAPNAPSPWLIFNDFAVHYISEQDALSFPGPWKFPCILYLERTAILPDLDFSGLPTELDPAILGQQLTMSSATNWSILKHKVLRFEELPKPGTLVAIDAEFVQLAQEETEIRSDGTKKVIRPGQNGLARVSVLRGGGATAGKPFIDDYIFTTDPIVDLLTEYSGIHPGDLDPSYSKFTLLPLKIVYKKLRLLVDLGCIFIGHGLSKDFRTINIFVPPERVIDTVDLYFLKDRHRRLSLRFLSWYVLKEPIQSGQHDSIEDARAALLLYEAYHKYEEEGMWDDFLEELYQDGRRLQWKVPEEATIPSPPTSHQSARMAQMPPFRPTQHPTYPPSFPGMSPSLYDMDPQAAVAAANTMMAYAQQWNQQPPR